MYGPTVNWTAAMAEYTASQVSNICRWTDDVTRAFGMFAAGLICGRVL